LDKIWAEIYKPEKFANSKPSDFFQFEYCMMPHKMYQEEQFLEKAKELKGRFAVGATNSLFLNDSEQKNIPLDGLHVYIDKSWDSIKDQKELNLPDQREMVANYRCIELKEEALEQIKDDLDSF
jgi:hypothetical protein